MILEKFKKYIFIALITAFFGNAVFSSLAFGVFNSERVDVIEEFAREFGKELTICSEDRVSYKIAIDEFVRFFERSLDDEILEVGDDVVFFSRESGVEGYDREGLEFQFSLDQFVDDFAFYYFSRGPPLEFVLG
jgi:hypothetical protein